MISLPLIHKRLFEARNIIRALVSSPNASFRALKRPNNCSFRPVIWVASAVDDSQHLMLFDEMTKAITSSPLSIQIAFDSCPPGLPRRDEREMHGSRVKRIAEMGYSRWVSRESETSCFFEAARQRHLIHEPSSNLGNQIHDDQPLSTPPKTRKLDRPDET